MDDFTEEEAAQALKNLGFKIGQREPAPKLKWTGDAAKLSKDIKKEIVNHEAFNFDWHEIHISEKEFRIYGKSHKCGNIFDCGSMMNLLKFLQSEEIVSTETRTIWYGIDNYNEIGKGREYFWCLLLKF